MFEIDHLDFMGSDRFNELMEKLFSNADRVEGITEDGVPYVRIYAPGRREQTNRDCDIAKTTPSESTPAWRREVRPNGVVNRPTKAVEFPKDTETPARVNVPQERKPKSIMEMLEDGDERLERLLGRIIDKKLAERNIVANNQDVDDEDEESNESPKKNTSVFIANRLTFLIQALQPIVFDTSLIETDKNSMTIAINESKTHPRITSLDDLGFLTSSVNSSQMVREEIKNYLDGTEFSNIYCFPSTIENKDGEMVFAVRFVVYPSRRYTNF